VLRERARRLLREDAARSIFRCPECGSFFDAARQHPETNSLARKCVSCETWYPVVGRAAQSQPAD
jgi:uncharacterized Zn finger protein